MKRKLAREPHRSPITDGQRQEILDKVTRGEASATDWAILGAERKRTLSKLHATREQLAHPNDPAKVVFAAPDERQASVTATVEALLPSAAGWEAWTHGQAYKKRQSVQAQQPRSRMAPIIGKLVGDNPESTGDELWYQFLGYEEQDLRIKDCGDYAQWCDDSCGRSGRITRQAFEVAVSRARTKFT